MSTEPLGFDSSNSASHPEQNTDLLGFYDGKWRRCQFFMNMETLPMWVVEDAVIDGAPTHYQPMPPAPAIKGA